jgi:hypothetical protein
VYCACTFHVLDKSWCYNPHGRRISVHMQSRALVQDSIQCHCLVGCAAPQRCATRCSAATELALKGYTSESGAPQQVPRFVQRRSCALPLQQHQVLKGSARASIRSTLFKAHQDASHQPCQPQCPCPSIGLTCHLHVADLLTAKVPATSAAATQHS